MKAKLFGSTFEFLFQNSKMAWFWLLVRVYLGWQWLHAGYGKLLNPAWVGDDAGKAIGGFVNGALSKMLGDHPDVSSWYGYFLQNCVLPNAEAWSYVITFGEILVGLGLILGAFTFLSAFFGFFMNLNFLFAGTVSVNPQLLVLALLVMLASKVAGQVGLDYFIRRAEKTWALFR